MAKEHGLSGPCRIIDAINTPVRALVSCSVPHVVRIPHYIVPPQKSDFVWLVLLQKTCHRNWVPIFAP